MIHICTKKKYNYLGVTVLKYYNIILKDDSKQLFYTLVACA